MYVLRLVVWIVPSFSVSAYRDQLRAHEQIEREGSYHATASRILIEAKRPWRTRRRNIDRSGESSP